MKVIPKKNYMITVVIILSTIVLTFILANSYKNKYRKTSEMYNYLSEIKINEIESYLFENPSIIIYFADKYNLNNDDKEIKLKKIINELNVYNYFIYLDINDVDESFLKKFQKKYNYEIKIDDTPLFLVINEGNVIESLRLIENVDIEKLVEDVKW